MIEINNISKRFNRTEALKNISLNINENEIFGLIGADGAGKTTLMRILVSVMLPDEGSILIDGTDVVENYKCIRKMVGYMPGRFSLYADLSVEENLAFYASVFGTTIQENYYLIENIYKQIAPFKNRRAGKLSGGMKQKLALCCALIHKPKILVLDEPTTGVDAVSRKEFWEMLSKLKQYNITILVSTPYMDEANLCDRVALIQEGKVLAVDAPNNITKNYGQTIFKVKTSETYRLLKTLKTWQHTKSVFPFGQNLHLTVESEIEGNQIKNFLDQNQFSEIQIEKSFSNIEDVFIDLMQHQSHD